MKHEFLGLSDGWHGPVGPIKYDGWHGPVEGFNGLKEAGNYRIEGCNDF